MGDVGWDDSPLADEPAALGHFQKEDDHVGRDQQERDDREMLRAPGCIGNRNQGLALLILVQLFPCWAGRSFGAVYGPFALDLRHYYYSE